MFRTLLIIFFINSISLSAQEEKRLALVIGNADYAVGKLKNPVNDALLMATAFDSLGFDVILDTNIQTQYEFKQVIYEFDSLRENYDVGFVYYAGHGIQVGSENFMIPTNEKINREDDVYYSGINVQMIIRILTRTTDQVNVLILDACRNNPFEQKWNRNRSYNQGNGLAKMQAPMGSLIAFATTAGNVAPDGDGENSIYCTALWNNMFNERVSLDQFFRDVRAEVSSKTNGQQQTEESTQLTGQTFYLVPSNYEPTYLAIDSLMEEGNYLRCLELTQSIINESPLDYLALYQRALIYDLMEKHESSLQSYSELQSLFPEKIGPFWSASYKYAELGNYENAIPLLRRCLNLDSNDYDFYRLLSTCYSRLGLIDSAVYVSNEAIRRFPNIDSIFYPDRFKLYFDAGDTSNAIKCLDEAISLNPLNWHAMIDKADILFEYDGSENDESRSIYEYVIDNCNESDPLYRARNNLTLIYEELGEFNKAIEYQTAIIDDYSVATGIDVSKSYYNRGRLNLIIGKDESAMFDLEKTLEIDSTFDAAYERLAYVNLVARHDTISALLAYGQMIKVNPSPYNYYLRGSLYLQLSKYKLAIDDFESATNFDYSDYDYWSWRAELEKAWSFYYLDDEKRSLELIQSALKNIDRKIFKELDEFHSLAGWNYFSIGKTREAEREFKQAINLNRDAYNIISILDLYWRSDDTLGISRLREEIYADYIDTADLIEVLDKLLEIDLDYRDFLSAKNTCKKLVVYNNNSENLSTMGYIYLVLGNMDSSLTCLNEAISLDSMNTSPLFYRSKVYDQLGETQNAINDLNRVINVDPNDPEGYYYLALFYESISDNFRALRNYDYSINNYVDNYIITDELGIEIIEVYQVYLRRAQLYKKLEEQDLMCEDLKMALELGAKISPDLCGF